MKKKKSRKKAIILSWFMIGLIIAIDTAVLLLVKDMMTYMIAGTFFGAVMLFVFRILLYKICDRSGYCYPSVMPYIAHSAVGGVVVPIVATLKGWSTFGEPGEFQMAGMVCGNLIIGLICTAIVGVLQGLLIEYICSDMMGFDVEYLPRDCKNAGAFSYSGSYSSSSSADDSSGGYTSSGSGDVDYSGNPVPDGPITLSKKDHEYLDDLSGSFTGTNT